MTQTAKKTTETASPKTSGTKVKESTTSPKTSATGSNVTALTSKGKTTNSPKASPASANTKTDVPSTKNDETSEPKPAIIKGAMARTFKSPPLKTNMRKITKMGVHPGASLRVKRWEATKAEFEKRKAQGVALTLRDMAEIEGLAPADAVFWHDNKLLTLTDPTEAEMKAATDAWAEQNKNNS